MKKNDASFRFFGSSNALARALGAAKQYPSGQRLSLRSLLLAFTSYRRETGLSAWKTIDLNGMKPSRPPDHRPAFPPNRDQPHGKSIAPRSRKYRHPLTAAGARHPSQRQVWREVGAGGSMTETAFARASLLILLKGHISA